MHINYFLGANSKDGFASLYTGFCSQEGDRLHIIKGGPGTGKSGFMKRIGAAAEEKGMDVEYVPCSGDPDSLDGVYLPALKQGWVDGTAPHVGEPRCFGVDADYVNLGRFCRLPLSKEDQAEIIRLNQEYKALYVQAYAYLKAAAELKRAYLPEINQESVQAAAEKRVCGIVRRRCGKKSGEGRTAKRFLSAVSCKGELKLSGEVEKLCKLIYQLDDGMGLAAASLVSAAREAISRGEDVILCPSPLCPEELEAVLLPGASLALLKGNWEIEEVRHIRLDALVPAQTQRELRPELRAGRRLERECMTAALEKLRQAKALHDQLEAVYRPYMDFAALTAFTDREIERIFGQ